MIFDYHSGECVGEKPADILREMRVLWIEQYARDLKVDGSRLRTTNKAGIVTIVVIFTENENYFFGTTSYYSSI